MNSGALSRQREEQVLRPRVESKVVLLEGQREDKSLCLEHGSRQRREEIDRERQQG